MQATVTKILTVEERRVERRSCLERVAESNYIDFERQSFLMYVGERQSVLIAGHGYFYRCIPMLIDRPEAYQLLKHSQHRFVEVGGYGVYIPAYSTIDSFDSVVAPELPDNPRVLLIRDEGAGDLMMSVPAIRELRRRLPGAYIAYATRPRLMEMLNGVDVIDSVVSIHEVNYSEWDLIINWSNATENYSLPRNRLPRIDSFAAQIGLTLTEREIEFHIPIEAYVAAKKILSDAAEDETYIGYVVKSVGWNRTYPIERIPDIADALATAIPGARLVLIDDQAEAGEGFERHPNIISTCGQTRNIAEAAAVMKKCAAVITPDTGLAHVAAALQITVVALCCVIPPSMRFNTYSTVNALYAGGRVSCCPCWDWQERWSASEMVSSGGREPFKSCKDSAVNKCMNTISVSEIIDAVTESISGGIEK